MATQEDQSLINKGKPAFKKLKALPVIAQKLRTKTLRMDFMDINIFREIAEWLVPDEKGKLPPRKIREELIAIVADVS